MRIYTLFDRKVGEYGSLVLGPTDESVFRVLRGALPGNSMEAKYPEDFELCYMGDFDSVTGLLTALPAPKPLGTVKSILGFTDVDVEVTNARSIDAKR